jgi:hypothetical protein
VVLTKTSQKGHERTLWNLEERNSWKGLSVIRSRGLIDWKPEIFWRSSKSDNFSVSPESVKMAFASFFYM